MPNYKKFAIAQLLLNAVMALAGITFGRAHVLVASVFAGVAIGLFAMSLITIGQFIGNAVEHMDCGREQKASFDERLTPVLMTALVAALALSPLLFEADRPGTEILHPVAVVIFSGLITSTLLDSFLTPAMVKLFGRKPIENLVAQSGSEAY